MKTNEASAKQVAQTIADILHQGGNFSRLTTHKKSPNRTAFLVLTLVNGHSVHFWVLSNNTPSSAELQARAQMQQAGGVCEFVATVSQFEKIYSTLKQKCRYYEHIP